YLTYVPGIFPDWEHPRHIVHLTSDDLVHWHFSKVLDLMSEKVIDAGVARLPDGTWRMWYNQEPGGKLIASADSKDLYRWEDHGLVPGIGNCEGPKPFRWKGSWWLICDEWKGFAVYRSDDAAHWTRQPGNLLQEPGKGPYDDVAGNHCDVVVRGDRAYIYYFAHLSRPRGQQPGTPRRDGLSPNTTFIQVAELRCEDGRTITCDRNAVTVVR
nr:glycosyl hydrolase [Bacteroidales bacterium]